ncbi:hypothetical protein DD238_007812 [Peronospora effusa]|uniref:CCHC-type domain-containing protein n=1 Tax=Peronospora effusa TaxID=542832 RepID=A0A3M6VNA4_9STRA|nr:hypothetical protein DD238_007812 [Peronospora effusa]
MNALRAELKLNTRSNEAPILNISNQQLHKNNQQPWKGRQRGRSQYKARGSNHYHNSGRVTGKQFTVKKYHGDNLECWNCHEKDHSQRDCTRPKYDIDESKSQLPERKRWENKKGDLRRVW